MNFKFCETQKKYLQKFVDDLQLEVAFLGLVMLNREQTTLGSTMLPYLTLKKSEILIDLIKVCKKSNF